MYGNNVQTTTINSGATLTGAVPIRGCNIVAVELQTFSVFLSTTTANIYIKVCDTSTGTFRRLVAAGIYSAGTKIDNYEVPSTTGNVTVIIPDVVGFNYAKIEFSNTCTATATIRIHKIQ